LAKDDSTLTVAREGFEAWRRGDFDTLEKIFAADVEWCWFEPGEWDCHSRDDVMRVLRQRHSAGFAEGQLRISEAGRNVVVVTAHPSETGGPDWPAEVSTVILFSEGKVVSMQDYRTEAEAFAATPAGSSPR
jgi:ketosteroid isomerase-like protein